MTRSLEMWTAGTADGSRFTLHDSEDDAKAAVQANWRKYKADRKLDIVIRRHAVSMSEGTETARFAATEPA